MREAHLSLNDILSTLSPGELSHDDRKKEWNMLLYSIVYSPDIQTHVDQTVLSETELAIDTFMKHQDHGINHSLAVYEGMKYLARQEQWTEQEINDQDKLFQGEALLHDVAQLLPNRDWNTGETLTTDQRKTHAYRVAYLTTLFGNKFGLTTHQVREMRRALYHHDDTWLTGQIYPHLPDSGKLLADSDKLFGSTFPDASGSYSPYTLAKHALERNLQGSTSHKGWYFLRNDLTHSDRLSWKYGDRWLADNISAIYFQFFRQHMYTQSGQKMFLEMQESFIQASTDTYGSLWEQQQIFLQEANHRPLILISKDGSEHVSDSIHALLDSIQHRQVTDETQRESLTSARGWKIQIEGTDHIIDPTIVSYISKEDFLKAIHDVCYVERGTS